MQVVGDPLAAPVAADPSQELDPTTEQGQANRDVQRAAADMFSKRLSLVLDDVDQRFADNKSGIAHRTPSTTSQAERIGALGRVTR